MTDSSLLHSTTTIRMLHSDSDGGKEVLLEKMGCFLKIINIDMELWQLETHDGAFILGVSNPFQKEEHFEALWNLLYLKQKDEFFKWMKGIFVQYGFGKKEHLLLQVDYTCRFVRNKKGTWRLFFPYDAYYMGGPEEPPVLALHSSSKMFPTVGEKFTKWLQEKIDKLYPNE